MLDRYIDGVLSNTVALPMAAKEFQAITMGTGANTTETNLITRLIDNEALQPGRGVSIS